MSTVPKARYGGSVVKAIDGARRAGLQDDFLEELTVYVGFTPRHAETLAELKPILEPSFASIVDHFYEAILANPSAMAVFTGGHAQIERQKTFLLAWLHGVLAGRYDPDYLRMRARIGRTHVRIHLDQRYVIGGMNVVRSGLHRAIRSCGVPEEKRDLAHEAVDKICDIELAIMVQTYAEDYTSRLRDIERLATLGQLAGFIGHELRNPLAVMETSLHLLKKRIPAGDEHLSRHARRLGEQLTTCGNIISSLVELAKDRALEREQVALAELFHTVLDSVQLPTGVALETKIAEGLPMAAVDPKQLRQLVLNLATNAVDAVLPTEGRREISITAMRESDVLLIAVEDSGPGVSEEAHARLFQPLATTRQKGLGLGLALCRRIAEKHGGDIRVQRGALGGARFEVRLPGAFAP